MFRHLLKKTLKKHEKTNIRVPFSKLNYPNLSPNVTIYGLSQIWPEFRPESLCESGKSGSGAPLLIIWCNQASKNYGHSNIRKTL